MSHETYFVVEPRDPLIARDGRPAVVGAFASLPFPPPGMLAGAARTRMASIDGAFACPERDLDRLLEIPVHGPLLAELAGDSDEVASWLAPAPRDAVLFGEADLALLRRLAPRSLPGGAQVGGFLGRGALEGLLIVGFADPEPDGKPLGKPPAFWRWERFANWLGAPPDSNGPLQDDESVETAALGLGRIERELRSHLALEPGERVGMDGFLFETDGLRFLAAVPGAGKLAVRRLALGLRTPGGQIGERTLALTRELAPLGGERRLARWRPATGAPWPTLPPGIRERVIAERRARIVLLTPGEFSAGSLPGWSGGPIPGLSADAARVTATVSAACVPRAEVVSGWELRRGQAKPSRRLAPAGSVYWVELGETGDPGAWCDALWLRPVSDDDQARRDGYGLSAIGVWEEGS